MAAANIIKLLAVAIILHKIVFIRLRALLSIWVLMDCRFVPRVFATTEVNSHHCLDRYGG
jgi:hypothetical protein